jgi:hypothetical protein
MYSSVCVSALRQIVRSNALATATGTRRAQSRRTCMLLSGVRTTQVVSHPRNAASRPPRETKLYCVCVRERERDVTRLVLQSIARALESPPG